MTDGEIDKLHAEAFRDLECRISDCVWMLVIALEMAERAIEGRKAFAVFEVAKRLKQFKADYQDAWYDEKGVPECT